MGKKKSSYEKTNEAILQNKVNNPVDRTINLYQLSLWSILILGIFLRLHQYLYNRSLWLDELSLVLNLVNRSFLELLEPLDYAQGAPIGFLLLSKSILSLFGTSEYVLRIVPLLSGTLSLFLLYKVARHYISQNAALFALTLFALSNRLIYYSSEVKQYSSDVLITLSLYLLAISIQKRI